MILVAIGLLIVSLFIPWAQHDSYSVSPMGFSQSVSPFDDLPQPLLWPIVIGIIIGLGAMVPLLRPLNIISGVLVIGSAVLYRIDLPEISYVHPNPPPGAVMSSPGFFGMEVYPGIGTYIAIVGGSLLLVIGCVQVVTWWQEYRS